MDDIELKALLSKEIDSAIGYLESETINDRAEAMNYYLRREYGNEVEGKSKIVTGEVAEAVDGALPQLMRVFTASADAVRYEPVNAGDEPFCEQATELANWVFYKDNPGFLIAHNWMKDALLQKVGVVKAYWEEKVDESVEKYEYLTDDELAMVLQGDDFEIIKHEAEENVSPDGMVYFTHEVKIKRKEDHSRIVIENVPPEEFLISRNAKTIEDAPFVAHRRKVTRGDLIAMGFKKSVVETLPAYDSTEYSYERLARFENDIMPHNDAADPSMEEVEVYECYVRADINKNGTNELTRVLLAGNEILERDDCDYVPFHSLCPLPIPHRFVGQSLADRTMDIQLTKSTILRQMLDNLYLTNNYRVGAVEGKVNLDDLLTSTAGGVIRMKDPAALVPLTVQSSAAQSFPMMEYLDTVQAKRTGISDMSQGLDPSVLQNSTATAVAAVMQQQSGKLELIARIFAETGWKSLFKGILHLLCKYQDKEKTVRINGKYVTFDPRQWSTQYDVTVNVGLGNGNRQEQIAMLQMILAKQEQIIAQYGPNNPLVTVGQYQKTLSRMIEMAGFKDTTTFLNEITPEVEQMIAEQASQPQPDPNSEAAQLLAQVEREKIAAKAQADAQKMEIEAQKMALEHERKMLDLQQREIKMQADYAMQQVKLAMEKEAQDESARMGQADMILKAISQLSDVVNKQGEQIAQVAATPSAPATPEAPKEPVVVNVNGSSARVKKSRAVKMPDGSWMMETVDEEVPGA